MSNRSFFTKQLTLWLSKVDWHFNTLLGITIECTDSVPDDCDALINELLLCYPVKPSEAAITEFLLSSKRLATWFRRSPPTPAITRIALQLPISTQQADSRLPTIITIGDLAQWSALTIPELEWFANFWRYDASTPEHFLHYRYDFLEKRDGGKRLIEKPKTRLKQIQRKIYHEILVASNSHPAAHGFCKGRNCMSHASSHVGKRYVMSYDIADCFHSISWPAVKTVFSCLGYPEPVSSFLTALCTHRVQLKHQSLRLFNAAQRERLKQRHLPQGAPSSPALANAALYRLDARLAGLAKSLDLDYSRYADDIAMSTNSPRDWRFLEHVIGGICLDEGVSLNHRKTRIKREHQKQRLVGIVVNNKPNIDRKHFDLLKATLTNCKRHGLESQNRNAHPHFRAHLLGRIQHVKSVNKQQGIRLERIYQEIPID